MPSINLAYLELRLSGGADNDDPDASLGGIMSSERIFSKTVTGISNITGVTVDDAVGLSISSGTLAFTASSKTLTLAASGVEGTSVAIDGDGRYALPFSGGFLLVTVTENLLPALNKTDTLSFTQVVNGLFDDIGKAECWTGDTEYRCLYMTNTHPTDVIYGARVFTQSQPTGSDVIWIGADPAGVGDGSSTGVATTILDESSAPSGVGFIASINSALSLLIGQLEPGQAAAIWIKRIVPAETIVSTPNDTCSLAFRIAI